jgi:hypothetical protein
MASVNKTFATVLGAVLLLIGILGFFNNPVLGIFDVNGLHNWIHVLSGIVLLVVAFAADGKYARNGNMIFGIVYGLVTILGFLGLADWLAVDMADNILHLVITVAALGVAFGADKN